MSTAHPSSATINQANNMAGGKGLANNLSPHKGSFSKRRKKERRDEDPTPKKINETRKALVEPYIVLQCRSVSIGFYKVTTSDTGCDIPVVFTKMGLVFTLPHAKEGRRMKKINVLYTKILHIMHLNETPPMILLMTRPMPARSLRDALGFNMNPDLESSKYRCLTTGCLTTNYITLVSSDIDDDIVNLIQSLIRSPPPKLDYNSKISLLHCVKPNKHKRSFSYMNYSPGSPPTSKIVSTTSVVSRVNDQSSAIISSKTPSSSSSSASTVQPIASSSICSRFPAPISIPVENQDSESAVLFYPGSNGVKIAICPNDINRLQPNTYFNDVLIAFWLAVIQTELLSDNNKNRTFVFDSFFYTKLTEKGKKRAATDGSQTYGERMHARVERMTKNVDIFEKDFLIVPINQNNHWLIAIICFPGLQGYHDYNTLERLSNQKRMKVYKTRSGKLYHPKNHPVACGSAATEDPDETDSKNDEYSLSRESTRKTGIKQGRSGTGDGLKLKSKYGQRVKYPCILIFDSLASEPGGPIFSTLREYLKIEYKTRKHADRIFDKKTMPGRIPKVPQQSNQSDCGLFLLQYVESFFSSPIETLNRSLKNWFQTSIVENKRREIYDFILKKVEELCPQNLVRIPTLNFEPGDNS
ncbi:unnamed protein product [Orchesella dallaii]|uniref:Ubiquitin-like protease family profile domain-containing protein n=1 Tax=Orchesella dallaii TaxID=48710 RepID=A0ABP1QN14_9HEXA